MAMYLALIAALTIAAMIIAWRIAVITQRFSWIDAIWSFVVGGGGVMAALAPFGADADMISTRQILVASLIAFWSLRLGLHLTKRSLAGGKDPRYQQLQRDWGAHFGRRLFWFLQIQAAVAFVLALAVMVASHRPSPTLDLGDWLGLAIAVVAVVGESQADRQLTRFRMAASDREDSKVRICHIGLWGLSRHPNYFFEWLAWVGVAVIGIDPSFAYPWGWVGTGAPIFMYWLLVHVSGIPPLEAHMLRSRGSSYRAYQDRMNAFWPGPPKRPARTLSTRKNDSDRNCN